MILVGLTGGIGSGKTTVAKHFLKLGIPVFFADDEAKWLMQNSDLLKSKIIETFGESTYLKGKLNKPYLANLVFNDKLNLEKLNNIVHPAVKVHFKDWLSKQKSDYIIYENAILFETNSASDFDFIICVTADLETRINRIIIRDHTTKAHVLKRIENQFPENIKIKHSDVVIINNINANLKDEVLQIHHQIISKFSSSFSKNL